MTLFELQDTTDTDIVAFSLSTIVYQRNTNMIRKLWNTISTETYKWKVHKYENWNLYCKVSFLSGTLLSIYRCRPMYEADISVSVVSWSSNNVIVELEYCFFGRAKREFFFQNLTLGYNDKNSESDYFFPSTKIRIFVSATLGKLFATFVDFEKAFDTVWRDALWSKLLINNINGKMYNVIYNMHQNIKSRIVYNGKVSANYFDCNNGVRQRENLYMALIPLYEFFFCYIKWSRFWKYYPKMRKMCNNFQLFVAIVKFNFAPTQKVRSLSQQWMTTYTVQ
jgi:hypothetical protein